jgi:Family of unknown function (DUF5681)
LLDTDNTDNTAQKQRGGFKPRQSGNPAGRPKGARNKTTLSLEALLDGEAEALTRKAIEKALEGDTVAMRLCLERIIPARRERTTPFDMPPLAESADARKAMGAIVAAVAEGELTPGDGMAIGKLIANFVAIDADTETERRMRDRKKDGPLAALKW